MSLQKDFTQPDLEAWFLGDTSGKAPLQEEDDINPLDYEQAIEVGGASAVYEPFFQTPDEKALAEEQMSDYAGTHEQFE